MDKFTEKIGDSLRSLTAMQIIVLFFATIILIGALILTLPIASRTSNSQGFFTALFTSVSAISGTGFTLEDIRKAWSPFGQIVILVLIEIGGLGYMSMMFVFLLLSKRKISMKQRMVLAQTIGCEDTGGIVRIERWAFGNAILVQVLGALAVMFAFLPHYDFLTSLYMGITNSVSAFCNCGLDFMGFSGAGIGLSNHLTDPFVLIPLMLLTLYGSIGFMVLYQIFHERDFGRLNVYAKLVLITTALLFVFGAVAYAVFEWNNPRTIGSLNPLQKILFATFQSVNNHNTGFYIIDHSAMTEESKALSCFLMFVGGSAGSTSGGIKTVTFAVLVLYAWNRMRGKRSITIYNRRITDHQVLDAMTITGLMGAVALLSAVVIAANSNINIGTAIFTCISAITTCGLSMPVIAELSRFSQILLEILMFFGRVGILSISLSFMFSNPAEERIQRAESKLIIG